MELTALDTIFHRKKIVPEKLPGYGFRRRDDGYIYTTEVLDGRFSLSVTILDDGAINTELIDVATNEEYVLHKTNASGVFVGEVRSAIMAVLQDICDNCYEPAVFVSEQTLRVIAYIRDTYRDELEYLWQKFPDYAVCRRKDNKKWYGLIMSLPQCRLDGGSGGDGLVEAIDLRVEPNRIGALIDHKKYYPGWHMNKQHWYTMKLDGSIPLDEMCGRIDESYRIAGAR